MNTKTAKYVDKDKIIPWIDAEIERLIKSGKISYSTDVQITILTDIKHKILDGLWDWQQGSE